MIPSLHQRLSMRVGAQILEWRGFPRHLQSALGLALTSGDYSDVTLLCQDQQVRSHKLLLAASSSVFRKILDSNLDCVFLRGVRGKILTSILRFIYFGKVQVPYVSLTEFLETAKDLKIEEIIKAFEIPTKERELEKEPETGEMKRNGISEENELEIIDYQHENESEIQESVTIAEGNLEPKQKPFRNHPLYDEDVDKSKVMSKCPECDNSYHPRWKLVRHYKLRHEGITFMCDQCGLEFGKNCNLKRHLTWTFTTTPRRRRTQV